jgi:hypothetical protein
MTWIKPSFLWLMERSGWGRKSLQERILAVRITRSGWERALSLGVLSSFPPALYRSVEEWRQELEGSPVRLQWDPERSLRGARLPHDAIQIGLGRAIVDEYADQWTVAIEDLTPRVRKMSHHLREGRADEAERWRPPERPYPVPAALKRRLLID